MKRFAPVIFIVLAFVLGIALVVYPLVSNMLYERDQSVVLAEYDEAVAQADQQALQAALQEARDYNAALLEGTITLTDPFDPEAVLDPTVEPYASLLNLAGDGMMGYVEIPKIDVYLPIYHGTTAAVLEEGVGHLQDSTLPVGGEGTHTVLTGHTGLPGKRLFTDLTELGVGDVFYIHVLGETLAYRVERIDIVEPDDTSLLVVQPGEDLATLLTCYPYGINNKRLLVTGERVPYEDALAQQQGQEEDPDGVQSVWQQEYRKAIIVCLAVYIPLTVIVVFALLYRRRRRISRPDGAHYRRH